MADGFVGGRDLVASLSRFIGETVTIFTTSGGLSGSGFTGVLVCVDCEFVKIITQIGAPPACPVGSACTGPIGVGGAGFGPGFGFGRCFPPFPFNPLGSVTEIPIARIASFTHNAI